MTTNSSSPSCQWRWLEIPPGSRVTWLTPKSREARRRAEAAVMALRHLLAPGRGIAGRVDLRDGVEVELGHDRAFRWASRRPLARRSRMTRAIDPVELASELIACPSVTPASGAVFDVLEAALTPLGFEVHRFVSGGEVENMFATRGSGKPAFRLRRPSRRRPAGRGLDRRSVRARDSRRPALRARRGRHEGRNRRLRRRRGGDGGASRHAEPAHHRRRGRPGRPRHPRDHGAGWRSAASGPT